MEPPLVVGGSNGAGCMKWSGQYWPTLHGLVVCKTSEAALAKVAEAPIDLLGKAGVSR